jgi:hypothetical protein
MTIPNPPKPSREITQADFEVAFEKIKCAMHQLLSDSGPIPSKAHWTLSLESTRESALSYLYYYGMKHLRELMFGLRNDAKFSSARNFDVVVDLNGAVGQGAILLSLLGYAKRAIVIDRSPGAAMVARDLATILNCELEFLDITKIVEPSDELSKVDSILILSNHAQNCWKMPYQEIDRELRTREQMELDVQNQKVLGLIAAITNPQEILAISLEPHHSQNNGLRQLLSPWQGTHDFKSALVTIEGLEFEIHGQAKKCYESSELIGPLVPLNDGLHNPTTQETPFGMFTVEYIPPAVNKIEAEVSGSSGIFITVEEHESLMKAYLEFLKKCKNSRRDENLLLFGEELPDSIWDAEDELAALLGFELEVTL